MFLPPILPWKEYAYAYFDFQTELPILARNYGPQTMTSQLTPECPAVPR